MDFNSLVAQTLHRVVYTVNPFLDCHCCINSMQQQWPQDQKGYMLARFDASTFAEGKAKKHKNYWMQLVASLPFPLLAFF